MSNRALYKAFGESGLVITPTELALIANAFRDRRQPEKVIVQSSCENYSR
jgi:hypothetical protein